MKATQLIANWNPRPKSGLTSMACLAWQNPRLINVEVATPTPKPCEVLIEVIACGVCGSDTHAVETDSDGYMLFSGPAKFPVTLGHEYSGRVVAIGSSVTRVAVGGLVAPEGILYCATCEACLTGLPNQCRNLKMVGFSSAGAYADFITVHERHCWNIDGLADLTGSTSSGCELGALIEPAGCAFNGLFVSGGGMMPGSHVAIFGCGPIGLSAIALARSAGAATICAFDRSEGRLQIATTMGADISVNVDLCESPAEVIRQMSKGWGADLVVEAAGAAKQTMPHIEASLAPRGTIVYLGRTGERAPIMLDALVTNAGRIVGARGHAGSGIYPRIIRMLQSNNLNLLPMITARRQFSEAIEAVEASITRSDAKIMLLK